MVLPLSPDVVSLVVEALLGQTTLTALVSDRIYAEWPDDQTWPMCTVDMVDQIEEDASYSSARIQVSCWGQGLSPDDEREAALIARTVQRVSRDIRGVWSNGCISNSAPLTITPAPDNGWWRYVIDLALEVYPNGTTP